MRSLLEQNGFLKRGRRYTGLCLERARLDGSAVESSGTKVDRPVSGNSMSISSHCGDRTGSLKSSSSSCLDRAEHSVVSAQTCPFSQRLPPAPTPVLTGRHPSPFLECKQKPLTPKSISGWSEQPGKQLCLAVEPDYCPADRVLTSAGNRSATSLATAAPAARKHCSLPFPLPCEM